MQPQKCVPSPCVAGHDGCGGSNLNRAVCLVFAGIEAWQCRYKLSFVKGQQSPAVAQRPYMTPSWCHDVFKWKI